MAHTATHIPAGSGILAPVGRVLTAIFDALVRIGEANPAMRRIEELSALSDEELAARGLRRQDIAAHVLKSSVWL